MPEVKVEVWKSDYNREEKHYFFQLGNGNHGYQNAEYLFGVNPKYFDENKIAKILELLKLA